MDEIAAGFHDFHNFFGHRNRRDGEVARRQSLGHCDDVGLHAHAFMAPHIAGAAKATDNLVADHEDTVFAADRLDLWPVVGGRDDDTAGTLHRFADEGGDVFRADFNDFVLYGLRAGGAEIFGAHVAAFIIPIRLADMFDTRDRHLAFDVHALIVHHLHSAKADARYGRAMIGVAAAYENGAAGVALHLPIMADHAQDGVVCFAARCVEEHMRQAVLRQAGDFLCEQHRGRRSGFEEGVVERQFQHLVACDVGQFGAAIADIDTPQARHAVEDAVAVAIIDVAAVGMGDNAAAAQVFDFLPVGLGGKVVCDVEAAKFGDVVIAGHDGFLNIQRRSSEGWSLWRLPN